MAIPKAEYVDWKNSTVTKEMTEAVKEVAEELVSEMVVRRASEPEDDQYIKGFIRGIQAVMEWEPELIEETQYDRQS